MAISPISTFLQSIRLSALRRDEAGMTDGQLLDAYVHDREEEAFAALLHRHGPMVWGVCRRVLGNDGDAEDAFQVTFLVLVRKAASVVPREQIANWLYGVARQTAVKARAMAVKRKAREKQVTDMPDLAVAEQNGLDDLLPVLDQELGHLPDKYRTAIVLCDLEGKSYKEAAHQLRCPEGTLAARLTRGRAMLSRRLVRHGLAVTSGMLAWVLSQSASARVPASVLPATMKAPSLFAVGQTLATGATSVKVASLSEGVLKTMLLSKLKIATAVFLGVTVLSVGIGRCLYPLESPNPISEPQARKEADPPNSTPKNFAKGGGQKRTTQSSDRPDGRNILRNPGFEEGDRLPTYWFPGAEIERVEYVWDKKIGQRGKASVCLHKTANRYFPIAQWHQEVDRKSELPTLRLAAQVKAEGVTKATIDVVFLDEKGEWIEHRWAAYIGAKEAKDAPVNHDWKEYTGRVEIPKGTKKIQIALQIYGPGKIWFDEVRAEYTNAQEEKSGEKGDEGN